MDRNFGLVRHRGIRGFLFLFETLVASRRANVRCRNLGNLWAAHWCITRRRREYSRIHRSRLDIVSGSEVASLVIPRPIPLSLRARLSRCSMKSTNMLRHIRPDKNGDGGAAAIATGLRRVIFSGGDRHRT
jgi:hypothetical protein